MEYLIFTYRKSAAERHGGCTWASYGASDAAVSCGGGGCLQSPGARAGIEDRRVGALGRLVCLYGRVRIRGTRAEQFESV